MFAAAAAPSPLAPECVALQSLQVGREQCRPQLGLRTGDTKERLMTRSCPLHAIRPRTHETNARLLLTSRPTENGRERKTTIGGRVGRDDSFAGVPYARPPTAGTCSKSGAQRFRLAI